MDALAVLALCLSLAMCLYMMLALDNAGAGRRPVNDDPSASSPPMSPSERQAVDRLAKRIHMAAKCKKSAKLTRRALKKLDDSSRSDAKKGKKKRDKKDKKRKKKKQKSKKRRSSSSSCSSSSS